MGKSGLSLVRWSGWFFWALLGVVQLARSGDPPPTNSAPMPLTTAPLTTAPLTTAPAPAPAAEASQAAPLRDPPALPGQAPAVAESGQLDRPSPPAPSPTLAERHAPAAPVDNPVSPQDAMLEDIVRLRRALGGPLVEDPAGDRAFADALRDLTRPPLTAPRLPPLTNAVPSERLSVEETPRLPLIDDSPGVDEVVVPAPAMLPHSPLADVLTTLRHASRELDMRAHDLDEQRNHKDADRVRQVAKRLRRDVRQLELDAEASVR